MKKSGKGKKGSRNRELGTGNGKKVESRPRGMKSSRPGKTIRRSSAAGPKADQKRAAEEREQTGCSTRRMTRADSCAVSGSILVVSTERNASRI